MKSESHWIFLNGIKFNVLLVFTPESYFKVPKTIRLNATHYLTQNFYK